MTEHSGKAFPDEENVERQLRDAREAMSRLERHARVGSWKFDGASGMVALSDGLLTLLGREDVDGTVPLEEVKSWLQPWCREKFEAEVRRASEQGKAFSVEAMCCLKSGRSFPMRFTGEPVEEGGGVEGATNWAGTMQETVHGIGEAGARPGGTDILDESDLRFRILVEQAGDDFFLHDDEGRFLDVNQQACRNLQYRREELLRLSMLDIAAVDDREARLAVWRSAEPGPASTIQTTHWRKDGSVFPVELRMSCYFVRGRKVFLSMARDITERLEAERRIQQWNAELEQRVAARTEELRDSETRWQFALDGSGDGLWDFNVETGKVFYSKQWKAMLGYDEDDVKDTYEDWSLRVHPDDLARCEREMDRYIAGEIVLYSTEHRMRAKDGSYRWIVSRGKAFGRGQDGRVLRMMGTHTDITERKETEERVRTLNERMKLAVAGGGVGIWEFDFVTRQFLYNNQMHEIYGIGDGGFRTGVPPDTFGGEPSDWWQVVHPDDLEEVKATLQASIKGGDTVNYEHRIIRPDGEVRHVKSTAQIFRDEQGAPVRSIGTTLDVTDYKLLAQALSAEKERLLLATKVSGIGIWELDLKTLELTWDVRMHEMFGVPPEEFSGHQRDWINVMHPDDREKTYGIWKQAVEENGIFDAEFRIVLPHTGEVRHLRGLARYVGNAEGTPEHSIGINWDVTAERLASEEMRKAKEAAEAAERAKSEFMASMSHEIRTPMNAIIGFAELLMDSPLSGPQKEMVSVVLRSGENLLMIVNDILDYSKVEAGRLRLAPAPFSICSVVRDVLVLLEPQSRQNEVRMRVEIDPALDVELLGDSGRIKQVITNLVGNAIKFTEKGTVKVVVKKTHAAKEEMGFRVEVRDTGIGIAEDMKSKLFRPFSQADGSSTRRFGGTGLGLAICVQLVELMKGKIGFDSREGMGSTFWFELMLRKVETADAGGEGRLAALNWRNGDGLLSYRPLSVLLVEDNAANQLVASRLLEQFGHRVTVAANGLQALKWLAAHPYDVVLMDCQMPEMDGFETTRRIRKGREPVLNREIPIIALTASGMPGSRESCLQAGMNDYVLKPLNRKDLAGAFSRCGMSLATAEGAVGPKTDPAQLEPPVLDPVQVEELRRLHKPDGTTLLKQVAKMMLEEMPDRLDGLAAFHAGRRHVELAQLAHKVAGCCASMGAKALLKRAQGIEMAARSEDWEQMPMLFAQIKSGWLDLQMELKKMAE